MNAGAILLSRFSVVIWVSLVLEPKPFVMREESSSGLDTWVIKFVGGE